MGLKAQTEAIGIHVYELDIEWLRQSDIGVAECTCPSPSLGVGYELAYAETHNIRFGMFWSYP